MLITAFLTFLSLEKGPKIITWWKSRYFRIAPAFYVSILAYLVVRGGNEYWLGNENTVTIRNIMAHILLIHGFFPHYSNSIIGVEWYIGLIVVFYLLAPLLYRLINSLEKSILTFSVATMLCYEINKYAAICVSDWEDAYIYLNYVGTMWLFAQLPVLLLVIVLYHLVKTEALQKVKEKRKLSIACLLCSIILLVGMMLDQNSIYGLGNVALFGIAFFLLTLSQVIYPCKFICNKVFEVLGKNSYVIYLVHVLLVYVYLSNKRICTGYSLLDWAIGYLLVICGSLMISTLWKYCEKKITGLFLQRRFGGN